MPKCYAPSHDHLSQDAVHVALTTDHSPNNNTTAYTYDNSNRRTRVTYPDASFESTAYDALGRVTSRTDAKGLTTQYGYDALGRLTSVTDALNQVTTYGYDEVGNRITQTDANLHTTSYQYDQRGRRTQRKLPLGQTESYTYDAAGNLATRTDFNGKTTTYAYDNMNRLVAKTPDASFGEAAVTYAYNTIGKRASMTDASGTTTFSYNTSGTLQQKNGPAGNVTYSYDLANNLTGLFGGFNVAYTYDALNRLNAVTETNTGTTTYSYDPVGNLQSVTYPNGVVHSYGYDNRNRLTNLGVAKGAANLGRYAYVLDASGHRTQVTELSGRTVSYSYDNLYRLASEAITLDPATVNGAVSYTYDAVGNRTQLTSTLAAVPAGLWNYDANDRFTAGDTYDANGNTVSSGGIGNAYDFENRLIQKGGVTIVYDGDGNRVKKTVAGVTTTYLVDDLNPTGYAQVLTETLSGNGTGNRELLRAYVYGLERISQRRSFVVSGNTQTQNSFYVYDGHGSVRALTSSTGAVTDTYDYDAFGNLIHSTGTSPNNYLFAGEQFDPDLHLYYNRARYLNVSTGRFWSMDAYEGNSSDPASLHKYLYANADPVDLRDPAGDTPLSDFIAKAVQRGIEITARAYGVLAHTLIEADIEATYPEAQTEVFVPGGRIDVYIPPGIYEIKPLGGVADPEKQLDRYLGALPLGAVRGTIPFDKTIGGPLVFDKIHYFLSSPGVITYDPSFNPTIPTLLALATVASYAADLAVSFGASLAVEALAF